MYFIIIFSRLRPNGTLVSSLTSPLDSPRIKWKMEIQSS